MSDVKICEHCGREFWWHDDSQITNYRNHIATCVQDQKFEKEWKANRDSIK